VLAGVAVKKVHLAIPSERLIGVTIPEGGHFFVCDHDEVWEVAIGPPLSIEPTDHEPYPFVGSRNDFIGWGQTKNAPILRCGANEISYEFDPCALHVEIRYRVAGREGRIEFPIFSGDWFCASFSSDGGHLVLAEPYRLDLYETG
jgi:hypothetical protein